MVSQADNKFTREQIAAIFDIPIERVPEGETIGQVRARIEAEWLRDNLTALTQAAESQSPESITISSEAYKCVQCGRQITGYAIASMELAAFVDSMFPCIDWRCNECITSNPVADQPAPHDIQPPEA